MSWGNGVSQQNGVLSGDFGRDKMGIVMVKWYFPCTFKHVVEIIKYCDVCQCLDTNELKKGKKLHTLIHLISRYEAWVALIWEVHWKKSLVAGTYLQL